MEKPARQWTREERQNLFHDYFGTSPGICPVCGHEVSMVMSNLGRTVTLLLSCDGCDNKTQVNRIRQVIATALRRNSLMTDSSGQV